MGRGISPRAGEGFLIPEPDLAVGAFPTGHLYPGEDVGRRLERGDGNSWQCIALQQKMARLQPGGRDSPWSLAAPLPHTLFSPAPVRCDPRPRVRLQNTTSDGRV